MDVKLVNLTPHALTVDGLAIPPSGTVARLAVSREQVDIFLMDGIEIPLYRTVFGETENLPEPVEGIVYIASMLLAQAVRRPDVVFPGEAIRDSDGRIIGCHGLAV